MLTDSIYSCSNGQFYFCFFNFNRKRKALLCGNQNFLENEYASRIKSQRKTTFLVRESQGKST